MHVIVVVQTEKKKTKKTKNKKNKTVEFQNFGTSMENENRFTKFFNLRNRDKITNLCLKTLLFCFQGYKE